MVKASSTTRAKKSLRHGIVSKQDKNLILGLSFVDFFCNSDFFAENFLYFVLSKSSNHMQERLPLTG